MNEELLDKIINKCERAYLYAQVIFSCFVILFGFGYALRCVIERSDAFYFTCFCGIGYVGYKLMLRASLQELREALKADKK